MPVQTFDKSDAIRLMDQYQAAIYRYVYACTGSHADSEDIYQNIFLVVNDSIERLHHEYAFYSWVREIAFKQVLAYRRTKAKEKPVSPHVISALVEAAGRKDQEEYFQQREKALFACMEKLSSRNQELIALRYSDSKDNLNLVAAKSGMTVNALHVRISRIRQVLRDCIRRRLSRKGKAQ